MYNKKPPFEITSSILDKIAEIAELVGQVNAAAGLTANPMLRRTNPFVPFIPLWLLSKTL